MALPMLRPDREAFPTGAMEMQASLGRAPIRASMLPLPAQSPMADYRRGQAERMAAAQENLSELGTLADEQGAVGVARAFGRNFGRGIMAFKPPAVALGRGVVKLAAGNAGLRALDRPSAAPAPVSPAAPVVAPSTSGSPSAGGAGGRAFDPVGIPGAITNQFATDFPDTAAAPRVSIGPTQDNALLRAMPPLDMTDESGIDRAFVMRNGRARGGILTNQLEAVTSPEQRAKIQAGQAAMRRFSGIRTGGSTEQDWKREAIAASAMTPEQEATVRRNQNREQLENRAETAGSPRQRAAAMRGLDAMAAEDRETAGLARAKMVTDAAKPKPTEITYDAEGRPMVATNGGAMLALGEYGRGAGEENKAATAKRNALTRQLDSELKTFEALNANYDPSNPMSKAAILNQNKRIAELRRQLDSIDAPEGEGPAVAAARPTTRQEYDALPSGAAYIDPKTGKQARKA